MISLKFTIPYEWRSRTNGLSTDKYRDICKCAFEAPLRGIPYSIYNILPGLRNDYYCQTKLTDDRRGLE